LDRQIIFPGAIPLETDLLATNKNAMMGLSKLAAAMFGTGNFVNGLSCGPNSPAALNVIVAPGEIYSLQNVDGTAYSSLAADTAHQVLKQGILMDSVTLACAAPGTAGQSINYLVQAAFAETDVNAVVLPYYNASNPSVAWSGPSNSGTAQFTNRQDRCVLSVVAGAAATTGTQTTPSPSAGAVGLWVVTVAQGQTTIVAGNITQYSGAALVPAGGAVSNAMNAILNKSVAGAANVTLDPNGEAAYPIINLTGALTGNINVIVPASSRQWIVANNTSGGFTVTFKTAAGTGIVVPQGTAMVLYCDGTNVQNATSSALTQSAGDLRYLQPTAAPATVGAFRNLSASATGLSATVLASADEIVVENASDAYQTLRSVSLTINSAAAGANGLDTGTLAVSTWCSLWVIWNGTTIAGLLSLSATAPTLPSDYTHKARIGWIRTDATANKFPLSFRQYGRQVRYALAAASNVTALPIMASGALGNPATGAWSAVSVANYVPTTALKIEVNLTARDAVQCVVCAPNANYGAYNSVTNPPSGIAYGGSGNIAQSTPVSILLESTSVYYGSTGATSFINCYGWEDNL